VAGINKSPKGRRTQMKNKLMKLSTKMQVLLMSEEGQDLIEYALVVALIAFAATAGMSSLANKLNVAFSLYADAVRATQSSISPATSGCVNRSVRLERAWNEAGQSYPGVFGVHSRISRGAFERQSAFGGAISAN